LTNTNLQCGKDCFEAQVAVNASNKTVNHLDNRGAMPLIVHNGSLGYKEAYGLRISATVDLQNQSDTVGVTCPYYFLAPNIEKVIIVTTTGLGPQYPPGSDVSSLFKCVKQESSQYLDMLQAPPYLNVKWSQIGPSFCDFLLLHTPDTPGWQQFDCQFMQGDSTSFSILSDSIYLQ
jgi:hypothetical protein